MYDDSESILQEAQRLVLGDRYVTGAYRGEARAGVNS